MTDNFYKTHPNCHKKCPVNGCDGFYTTTGNPNILQHIKGIARAEVFKREFFPNTETPHLDYIKQHYQVQEKIEKILILK